MRCVAILLAVTSACGCIAESDVDPVDTLVYRHEHKFGVVERGALCTGSIDFHNSSDTKIVFSGSRTSCGCLAIDSMPTSLASGETGRFGFSMDTGRRSGYQEQTATIFVEEGARQNFRIKVSAISEACWPFPSNINFGTLSERERLRTSFQVICAGLPQAHVLSVDTDVDWVAVEFAKEEVETPTAGMRSIARCTVEFLAERCPIGPLKGIIEIKVATDEEVLLKVPVEAYFAERIRATPAHIVFGVVGEEVVRRECSLQFTDDSTMQDLVFSSEHEGVTVAVKAKRTAKQLILQLSARQTKGDAAGRFIGDIVGRDADGNEVVRVPFVGIPSS